MTAQLQADAENAENAENAESGDLLRLPAGTTVGVDDAGRTLLGSGSKRFAIGPLRAGTVEVVRVLVDAGATRTELAGLAGADGPLTEAQVHHVLGRLGDRGWLERTVRAGDTALASLRPFGASRVAAQTVVEASAIVALSRFASLRREGSAMVLGSPRSTAKVVLHDPRVAALIASLSVFQRAADVATSAHGLPPAAASSLLRLFGDAGVLAVRAGAAEADGEEADMALAQWSFADLAFHAASRYGRQAGGYGATFPLEGRFEPLPDRQEVSGRSIDLDRPDLDDLATADAPFTAVVERRRSIREHHDRSPVTLGQLGDFLYRSAGVRPAGNERDPERSTRPYPSGGGLYELELYPVVSRCAGLDPGLYHYDPVDHRLRLVVEDGPAVHRLLDDARARSLMVGRPQVLIVVAARFGRVMFKYEAMAYATILKNVGALYQSMYCVATAMGLAPCALGGGNPDVFSTLAELDYYAESSVGEFLVGSAVATASEPVLRR